MPCSYCKKSGHNIKTCSLNKKNNNYILYNHKKCKSCNISGHYSFDCKLSCNTRRILDGYSTFFNKYAFNHLHFDKYLIDYFKFLQKSKSYIKSLFFLDLDPIHIFLDQFFNQIHFNIPKIQYNLSQIQNNYITCCNLFWDTFNQSDKQMLNKRFYCFHSQHKLYPTKCNNCLFKILLIHRINLPSSIIKMIFPFLITQRIKIIYRKPLIILN